MPKRSKNPVEISVLTRLKHLIASNKVTSLVTIVLSAIIIHGLAMSAVNFKNISILNSDLDDLQTTLQQKGFDDAEVLTGCWNTQGKFDTGSRVCEKEVISKKSFTASTNNTAKAIEANQILSEFITTVNNSGKFKRVNVSNGAISPQGQGISDFGEHSPHTATGAACGTSARYNMKKREVAFGVRCITTPWLSDKIIFYLGVIFLALVLAIRKTNKHTNKNTRG